ncbi:aspartate aminotransferase family protein [Conexibacter woesei]|uniref:Aminotransferase class-III n=1 Tax=Conexibacter woesei (strain DSM 14684 / CCUG 47730 / CIP 108061 / JCM 11494 / NBRC 100937 / ID131577) TaxID=469383 RepID=D3EZ21_CONWI|nr:aspartate aminotransferase family protein [Conexibacter woesei]ADB49895.1 aminotransferase class-III [Conexibacter woesei DSM 14684]
MIDLPDLSAREWTERAERVIPGGVNSGRRRIDPPLVAQRGEGAYLVEVDGTRVIDFYGGAGTAILGHNPLAVSRAVTRALTEGPILSGAGVTPREVQLAETITRFVPSVEQVLFCNSGSEATAMALRLARAVTGRQCIVKVSGHYHGNHDAVLFNTGAPRNPDGTPTPESCGLLDAHASTTLVSDFNDLGHLETLLATRGDEIAAVIMEPIAHNGGPTLLPDSGYLAAVRSLCTRYGALLIFDEVVTLFRHAMGGVQGIFGVAPDLTTAGKALANGLPIGMVGGRSELMARWTTSSGGDTMYGGTYNGNSASVAAALATLGVLASGEEHARITGLGEAMRDGLTEIAAEEGVAATATGFRSVFTLWFGGGPFRSRTDALRGDEHLFRAYRQELRARGVFEKPDRDGARSVISAAHTRHDIDFALEMAREALRAAKESRV